MDKLRLSRGKLFQGAAGAGAVASIFKLTEGSGAAQPHPSADFNRNSAPIASAGNVSEHSRTKPSKQMSQDR